MDKHDHVNWPLSPLRIIGAYSILAAWSHNYCLSLYQTTAHRPHTHVRVPTGPLVKQSGLWSSPEDKLTQGLGWRKGKRGNPVHPSDVRHGSDSVTPGQPEYPDTQCILLTMSQCQPKKIGWKASRHLVEESH